VKIGGALALLIPYLFVEPTREAQQELCAVSPTFEYYQVNGSTREAIERSLRENGPIDETGQRRFAYTRWSIQWKWQKVDLDTVDLQSLRLTCGATIQLPRLVVSKDTSSDLIRAWNEFVERTRQHELSHLKHAEVGAPRIRARLQRLVAEQGSLTAAEANAEALKVIAEIRAMDRAYDLRTNHGLTEGTWKIEAPEESERSPSKPG
jgi:predicted secreted Zn-dependent protease